MRSAWTRKLTISASAFVLFSGAFLLTEGTAEAESPPAHLWTRQFGTSDDDSALGVAVGVSGIYDTGVTNGALPGQSSAGTQDAFVRMHDVVGKSCELIV